MAEMDLINVIRFVPFLSTTLFLLLVFYALSVLPQYKFNITFVGRYLSLTQVD